MMRTPLTQLSIRIVTEISEHRENSRGENYGTLSNVCSVHRGMFSTSGGVQYIGGCSVHRGDTKSTSGGYQEYIGGIPRVHRGDIMSTSGGVQYIGGIPWVHRGVFSTSEGYHEYIRGISWVHRGISWVHRGGGGYHEYIGGCSVHRGIHDTCGGYHEYIGGYHEYIGGCSVHRGDTMSTSGDIMSTSGDVQYIGGYSVHREMFSTSKFSIEIERILSSCSLTCIMIPSDVLNIPRCTHDIPPMYSWYPSDVLNIPDVLMVSPHIHHDIPPDVLMISPRCTEHTLYRVILHVPEPALEICPQGERRGWSNALFLHCHSLAVVPVAHFDPHLAGSHLIIIGRANHCFDPRQTSQEDNVSDNSKPDHPPPPPWRTQGIRIFSLSGGSGFRPTFFARMVGVWVRRIFYIFERPTQGLLDLFQRNRRQLEKQVALCCFISTFAKNSRYLLFL